MKKSLETLRNEALDALQCDDLFVDMVNELDSYMGYADGFRAYPMDEINDLFCDTKVSDFLDKLAGDFCHTDDYMVDTIYGLSSTNDIAGLYRDNVDEEDLLDNIIEYCDEIWFYNNDFESLIMAIVNYDDEQNTLTA